MLVKIRLARTAGGWGVMGVLYFWTTSCHLVLPYTGGNRIEDAGRDLPNREAGRRDGPAADNSSRDGQVGERWLSDFPCSDCPTGWTPVILKARSPTAGAQPCPTGWTEHAKAMRDVIKPFPGCTPCSCSDPSGRTCTATFYCYDVLDPNCANPTIGGDSVAGTNLCINFSADRICSYIKVMVSGPTGGICSTSAVQKLPFTWATVYDLCKPSVTPELCTCLPGFGGFSDRVCLAQSGDLPSCPPGFPKKEVLFTGATDDRSCDQCTCQSPTGGTCAQQIFLYPCENCDNGYANINPVAIGKCTSADNATRCFEWTGPSVLSARYAGLNPGTSFCTPGGGAVSGTVTPTGPLTICCP